MTTSLLVWRSLTCLLSWYLNDLLTYKQHCALLYGDWPFYIDSAPSLGVYYFFVVDSVCLYVCMYVCHAPSHRFFFFVSRWNRAIFGSRFSMWRSTKRCSSIFDLGPITPKIYSPKFGTKSPISPLVWQIDRICWYLPGGFQGWPIQWNHAKCCVVDPCCHDNEIWAKIAYNSACMADRPHMFAPTRGFSGMADWTKPCKCCVADPCCLGNEIWAKIAYKSTCTAYRPQMFRPSRGFSGMADSMQPCKIL